MPYIHICTSTPASKAHVLIKLSTCIRNILLKACRHDHTKLMFFGTKSKSIIKFCFVHVYVHVYIHVCILQRLIIVFNIPCRECQSIVAISSFPRRSLTILPQHLHHPGPLIPRKPPPSPRQRQDWENLLQGHTSSSSKVM